MEIKIGEQRKQEIKTLVNQRVKLLIQQGRITTQKQRSEITQIEYKILRGIHLERHLSVIQHKAYNNLQQHGTIFNSNDCEKTTGIQK